MNRCDEPFSAIFHADESDSDDAQEEAETTRTQGRPTEAQMGEFKLQYAMALMKEVASQTVVDKVFKRGIDELESITAPRRYGVD